VKLSAVNLSIVQLPGDVHALGFLDQARYLRYHLGRLGVACRLSKNRLYRDRLNVVLGAHRGFDPQLAELFACVILNLEQIGSNGAQLPPAYFDLLRTLPSIDYDPANQRAYAAARPGPCLRLLDAPYVRAGHAFVPLQERPIDLLFFGAVNERRLKLIQQIEAQGCSVTLFDQPLFGPERDQLIGQAKAVLNLHFYETGRLEQTRIAHCLSLGTPVISERKFDASIPAEFDAAVFWVPGESLAASVAATLTAPDFYPAAERKIAQFRSVDALAPLLPVVDFLTVVAKESLPKQRTAAPIMRLNVQCGKDYLPGWINTDVVDSSHPDLLLDLSRPLSLPVCLHSPTLGQVTLSDGCLAVVHARDALQQVADLPVLMTNALALLAEGGVLAVEVPHERALAAWQDPRHVRAMNENSWACYTDQFWSLGWFSHRFAVSHFEYLDQRRAPCERERSSHMRVLLRKVATSLQERMAARTMGGDFGPGLEHDGVLAAQHRIGVLTRGEPVAA
jgi:hypothetical protein